MFIEFLGCPGIVLKNPHTFLSTQKSQWKSNLTPPPTRTQVEKLRGERLGILSMVTQLVSVRDGIANQQQGRPVCYANFSTVTQSSSSLQSTDISNLDG